MSKELRVNIAEVDKQLSTEAQSIRQTISAGAVPKITISRNGTFVGPDGLELGEEISGVIVDFVSANKFYPHAYNANNPLPPVCFAFGKVIADMKPDPSSPEMQDEVDEHTGEGLGCASCPRNQFGSALNGGKGKACKNTRELAFILEEDLENPDATMYLISVPPTAIRSFDACANLIGRMWDGPPIKAIVKITARPQGQYTTMTFEAKAKNEQYPEHFQLRKEAEGLILQLPDLSNYVPSNKQPPAPAPTPARARR